jgi:hypothetical protein
VTYISKITGRGIQTFPHFLHFHNGSGGNVTMNNGSFFRVPPSTFASGSFAGYNACFPLQAPFPSRLVSIELTFTIANFDFNATAGTVRFDLEFRRIIHNGSSVYSVYTVEWGNFSGSQISYDLNKFSLDASNFSLISGTEELTQGDLIGFRFVKSSSGVRRINNFQNILMVLNFEEA